MIRWDEPIEAVHEDGRVVAATSHTSGRIGGYRVQWTSWPDNAGWIDYHTGLSDDHLGWRIRNVATSTPPNTPAGYSDEVVERISRALRAYARNDPSLILTGNSIAAELYALADLLPEPVDADRAEARECVAKVYEDAGRDDLAKTTREGKQDNRLRVQAALAAIRRGRALAAGDRLDV